MHKSKDYVSIITNGVKRIPDISQNIFAVLAIFLSLSGCYFALSIIRGEYKKDGSLRVISSPVSDTPLVALEVGKTDTWKGKYVASHSGGFYYLPTCAGAKRIKEKNQVWYESKDDAEARGLKPSANCPGL